MLVVKNRKAYFNYEVIEDMEVGIVLTGTEIKSIRLGQVDMSDAFCIISTDYKAELHQLKITPYKFGNIFNHDPQRIRTLLLHKHQIKKLDLKLKIKGLTLIPLSLYFKKQHLKVKLGLCRGRKIHDKAKLLKARDVARKKSQEE